jgi:hypothetical protein
MSQDGQKQSKFRRRDVSSILNHKSCLELVTSLLENEDSRSMDLKVALGARLRARKLYSQNPILKDPLRSKIDLESPFELYK